jgi:hypothetical protein
LPRQTGRASKLADEMNWTSVYGTADLPGSPRKLNI